MRVAVPMLVLVVAVGACGSNTAIDLSTPSTRTPSEPTGSPAEVEDARDQLFGDLSDFRDAVNLYQRLGTISESVEEQPEAIVRDGIAQMEAMAPVANEPLERMEAAADAFVLHLEEFTASGGDRSRLQINEADVSEWRSLVDDWLVAQRYQQDPSNFCLGENLPPGALDWNLEQLASYEPFGECLLTFVQSDLFLQSFIDAEEITRLSNLFADRLRD